MMPLYHVEGYELWVQRLKIEATDEADAVAKVLRGEGCLVSMHFAGVCDDYGMGLHENADLARRLLHRGVIDSNTAIIPSIRGVQKIELMDQEAGT